jgi:hypothetical protein
MYPPGVPIVAANMDTTGTFETAAVMGRHKLLTAASKHYSAEEWSAQPAEVSWARSDVAMGSPWGLAFLAYTSLASELAWIYTRRLTALP